MLMATLRATVKARPEARKAGPLYLDLLTSGPARLSQFLTELEADPLFAMLQEAGVVRKWASGGRIPPWKRRNWEEEKAISLLLTHGLGDGYGWREEFMAARGRPEQEALAAKYHLGTKEVRIICDYARGEQRFDPPTPGRTHRAEPAEGDSWTFASDDGDVRTRAGGGKPGEGSSGAGEPEVIASVIARAGQREPSLVMERSFTSGTYAIQGEMAGWGEAAGVTRSQLSRFLAKLKTANQISACIARIARCIFEAQHDFFSTFDVLRLRPLSQASIARALGVPRSTVCRALKGRAIRTSAGITPLAFFCQRVAEVVRRLGEAHPQMTDKDLGEFLREEYGCSIGRRTVAYHRRGQRSGEWTG